jgi:hypothetical protein
VALVSTPKKRAPRGGRLDGWQAGALALVIGGSALLLAVPRAVEPSALPQPRLDTAALAHIAEQDDDLARRTNAETLDVDVRALGREIRAYNTAAAGSDESAFAAARERVARAAQKAGPFGEQLIALRAYQQARFLDELHAWQKTGTASAELIALSGDFLDAVVRSGWCVPGGRELIVGDRELRALFKKRWNTIVSAEGETLALSADEERARLGFVLAHPFVANDPATRDLKDTVLVERRSARTRLKTIEHLAALDADYPAELARGVVLYRTAQFQPAADAFRRHLEAHPDGAYTLRARNYLKATLDHLGGDG